MARTTKLELEQRLNAALTENEALRSKVHTLEGDVQRLQEHLSNVTEVASAMNSMRTTDPVVAERQAAMAAARELAMRFGRVTKVQ